MSDVPVRFGDDARAALYRVMELRRDIRHFRAGEIDEATLARLLQAAQLAPSVGFSQPWGFVIVRDRATRTRIRASFLRCREAESARFPVVRREKYLAYKLEGIEDATLNVCVVADLRDRDEAILGTTAQPEAVRASVCCAVQNLWLAARAEGLGVGWVSIVEPAVLRQELTLPPGVEPVAYLCLGHAAEFRERPLLEETGWSARRDPERAVHRERWSEHVASFKEGISMSTDAYSIPKFNEATRSVAIAHQLELTKPAGSLGRLEEIAVWYAGAHGKFPPPRPDRAMIAVFAGDHGVAAEGVSAFPSSVTAAMVANMMAGGAAVTVMAKRLGVEVALVDVGVAGDLSAVPTKPRLPLQRAKVRAGTANLRREPAMSRDEAIASMLVGEEVALRAVRDGNTLLAAGEIGIANTTAAAALVCALTSSSPEEVVGLGTGISEATRVHKAMVVADALRTHAPLMKDAIGILAAVGGLELAAMTGFYLAAARAKAPVIVDGFLATAAALVAKAIDANATDYMLASHASAERGSVIATTALGKRPLFDLGLRLGEGTGAVLAIDLVRTAVELQLSMATFATAGVAGRNEDDSVAPAR